MMPLAQPQFNVNTFIEENVFKTKNSTWFHQGHCYFSLHTAQRRDSSVLSVKCCKSGHINKTSSSTSRKRLGTSLIIWNGDASNKKNGGEPQCGVEAALSWTPTPAHGTSPLPLPLPYAHANAAEGQLTPADPCNPHRPFTPWRGVLPPQREPTMSHMQAFF